MSAAENKAVFLSYASQDAEAARRICETLRASGVEVWFDADGGLEHGDEWDAKIRRQIKECVLFIPLIAPDDADVLTDACTVGQAFGDWTHSIAAGQRAVSLDPVNPEPRLFLAISFFHSGRLPEAEAEIRRACELAPAGVSLRLIACQILLAAGRAEDALAEARQETGRMHRLEALALAEFACGRRREADAALAALEREFADSCPFQIAEVYAARHDPTPAFEWLEHAWQVKDPGTGWARVAATLKKLHRDPRWPVFLKKIGLHDEQLK